MDEQINSSVFEELAQERKMFEYATTGQRFANYIIDTLVFYAFNYLVFFITGICMALSGMDADEIRATFDNKLILYGIVLLNMLVIYTLIEGAAKGGSLGKLITGTKAVKEDLSRITWKDAFIRTLCRMIPFEPLSALGGYPWHDQLSHTHVIKKNQAIFE